MANTNEAEHSEGASDRHDGRSNGDQSKPGTSDNGTGTSQPPTTSRSPKRPHSERDRNPAKSPRESGDDSGKDENAKPDCEPEEKVMALSHSSFEESISCREEMPTFSSDSRPNSQTVADLDQSDMTLIGVIEHGQYERTDLIPFPVLLQTHRKQFVSGFEFGAAIRRQAEENIKAARDSKRKPESSKRKTEQRASRSSDEEKKPDEDGQEQPCCSKQVSEQDHRTPHSHKRRRQGEWKLAVPSHDYDFSNHTRGVPEPLQDYPDCIEVWNYMIYKEEATSRYRNPRLFYDFKSVTPRMRAILLDWMMEVCEVYRLRRVTYYLSVDYFDRYLSLRPDIPKSSLQLVGITCLYVAAKVEEIYPPNMSEFSYVCDGACRSSEMVACELLLLNSLGWEVISTTPSDWLNLYMQLHYKRDEVVNSNLTMDFNRDFVYPQYSAYHFARASQLMDLMSIDPGFLNFSYSVVAAAALSYMYGEDTAVSISGLTLAQLRPCIDYMSAFHTILRNAPDPRLEVCPSAPSVEDTRAISEALPMMVRKGPRNQSYALQTHAAGMDYLEQSILYRLALVKQMKASESENSQSSPSSDAAAETDNETPKSKLEEENALMAEIAAAVSPNAALSSVEPPEEPINLDEMFDIFFAEDSDVDEVSDEE